MKKLTQYLLLASLSSLSFIAHSGEETLTENPSTGLLKDTFVVTYDYDDFSDKVNNADVLFIPADYQTQAAFFLRCRPFFTNFSVEFLERADNLKESDGSYENDSPKFAKHGYIYDTEHDLKIKTDGDSERMDISVGGQNNHLSKHFKTDIKKSAGLLGMSFHFTFNYQEMPSFRSVGNTSEAEDAFTLLNRALKQQTPLIFELGGRNQAQDRMFSLDTKRMKTAVPQNVIDFCFSKRQLRD